MSASEEKFMSIAGMSDLQNKCFEEVRMDDYVKAYSTTGKPPQPCPQQPVSQLDRSALNLAPLFKPYPVSSASSNASSSSQVPPKPSIVDPTNLPEGQEFRSLNLGDERYHSVGCMTEYAWFSHEELRYYAYLRGNSLPPPIVKIDPFVMSVNPVTPSQPSSSLDPSENLQCISAQPPFSEHSIEELRVAYLLAGRELNSAEIRQQLRLPAPTPPVAPVAPVAPGPPQPSQLTSAPPPPLLGSSLGAPFAIQQKAPVPSFTFKF